MRYHGEENVLIVTASINAGQDVSGMSAPIAGRAILLAQRHHRKVHLMHMEIGVEQRGVEILSSAGTIAMDDSEAHSHRSRYTGRDIADSHGSNDRRVITFAEAVG